MRRVVALPMYDAPAEALAHFWQGLRGHLRRAGLTDVPERLTIPDDFDAHWMAPDLLLSQSCGYPLTTDLAGRVHYLGTPHYRAPGCRGPFYSSAVIVRHDDAAHGLADLRGRRAAFNGRSSQSGYNALRAVIAPLAQGGRFFASVRETGAHRASARAVREGEADVAALDAVSFALLARDRPHETAGLRVLAFTPPMPGLPLITAHGTSPAERRALRDAWAAACIDPDLEASRAAMLLDGVSVLDARDYAAIPAMADAAGRLAYPELM